MEMYQDQQLVIKRLQEQIKYFSERGMATNSSTLCDRVHALQTRLNKILENKLERPKEQKNKRIQTSINSALSIDKLSNMVI